MILPTTFGRKRSSDEATAAPLDPPAARCRRSLDGLHPAPLSTSSAPAPPPASAEGAMSIFGVFFVGKSFPVTDANFTRVDNTHWVSERRSQGLKRGAHSYFLPHPSLLRPAPTPPLPCPSTTPTRAEAAGLQVLDVTVVNPAYEELKEVALFLTAPGAMDPQFGVGLYVSVGGSEWSYRGYVGSAHPSEVMPLQVSHPLPLPPLALGETKCSQGRDNTRHGRSVHDMVHAVKIPTTYHICSRNVLLAQLPSVVTIPGLALTHTMSVLYMSQWPKNPTGAPGAAQIGISIEPIGTGGMCSRAPQCRPVVCTTARRPSLGRH